MYRPTKEVCSQTRHMFHSTVLNVSANHNNHQAHLLHNLKNITTCKICISFSFVRFRKNLFLLNFTVLQIINHKYVYCTYV